ncbi:uncharacterized protein LOC135489823 [Lineus longissimus]|uniref:uncharacterized protein LOC135489823 n=1 Tax=Lineus longissimus TaxID=88925 RepID=UPI002B4F192A
MSTEKKSRFKLKRTHFVNSDSFRGGPSPAEGAQPTPEQPVMSEVQSKVPPIIGESGDKATPGGSDLWDWDDTEKTGDDTGEKPAADSGEAANTRLAESAKPAADSGEATNTRSVESAKPAADSGEATNTRSVESAEPAADSGEATNTLSVESAKPANEPDRKTVVSLVDYEFDSSSAEDNQDVSSGDDKDADNALEKVQIEGNINCDDNGVEKGTSADLASRDEGNQLSHSGQGATCIDVTVNDDESTKLTRDEKEAEQISDKKGCNLTVEINKGTSGEAEVEDLEAEEPSSGGTTKSPGALTMQNLEILQKMAENLVVEGTEEKSVEEVPVESISVEDKVQMDVKSEEEENLDEVQGKDTTEELDKEGDVLKLETEGLPGGSDHVEREVEAMDVVSSAEDVANAVNQSDAESELPGGEVPIVAGEEDGEGKDTREELDEAGAEVQQEFDFVGGENGIEVENFESTVFEGDVSESESQRPSGVGSEWKSSLSAESSSDGPELASPGTTQKVWGALRSEVGDVVSDIDNEMDSFVKDFQPKEKSPDKETMLSQNDSVSNDQENADNSYSSLPKTFGGFKPRKRTFNVNFPIPESYRAVLRLSDVFTTMKHLTGSVYETPDIVRIDPLILKEKFGEEFVAGFFDSATSEDEDYILVSKKVTKASGGGHFEKNHVKKELPGDMSDGWSGSSKAVAKKNGRGRTPKMLKSVEKEPSVKKFQSENRAGDTQILQKTPVTKPKSSTSDFRERETDTPSSQVSQPEISFNYDNTPSVKLVGIFDSPSARLTPPLQKEREPVLTRLCHGGGRGTLNVDGGNFLLNRSKWWENIPKKKVKKVLNRSVGEASEVESTASFDSLGRVSPVSLSAVEERETKPKVVPVKKIPMAKKSTGGNKQSKLLGESQKPMLVKSEKKVPMVKEEPDKSRKKRPPKKRLVKDDNNIKNLFDLMSLGRLEIIVERCDAMLDSSVVIVKKEKGDNSFVDIEGVEESYKPLSESGRPRKKSKSPARHALLDSESDSCGGGVSSSDLGTKEVSYENFLKAECESSLSDGENSEHSDFEHRKRARLKKSSGSDVSIDGSVIDEKSAKKKPKSNIRHDKKDRSKNTLNFDSDSESDSFKMVMKKPSVNKIDKKRGRGRPRKDVGHRDADEKPKKKRKKLPVSGDELPDFSSTDDEIATDMKPRKFKAEFKSPKQGDKKVSTSRHFSSGLIGTCADFSSDEEKVGSNTATEGLKFQIAGLVDSPKLWGDDQEPPRQGHGVTRQDSAPIFIQCSKSTTSIPSNSDSDASLNEKKDSGTEKDKQNKKKLSRDTDAIQKKKEKSKAFDAVKKMGPKSKQAMKKSDSFDSVKTLGSKKLKLDKVIKSEALEERKKLDSKSKTKIPSKDEKQLVIKDLLQDSKGSSKKIASREVDWIPESGDSKTDKKVTSGSESDVEVVPSPPRPAAEVVKISSDSQDSDVDVHSIPTTESPAPFVDVEMGFSSENDDGADDVVMGDSPEQSEKEPGDRETLEKSDKDTKQKTVVSKETVKKESEQNLLKKLKISPVNVKLTRLNSDVRRILRKRKHMSIHRYEKLTGVIVQKKAHLERQSSTEKHKKVFGTETDKKSSLENLVKEQGKEAGLEKSSGNKSFLKSLQDEYDSSPERPAKDKESELEKKADGSSVESDPGFPGSDEEMAVLDEVGGDTCSSDDAAEAVSGASDKQSSDEEVKQKGKKRVLRDSDDDDEPAAPSADDKGKNSDEEAPGKKNTPEVEEKQEEDLKKSLKKEVADSRKKVSAKEESMKKLKMSRKKQKGSGSSLNDILFGGGPVFGENVTPSLSTFKIPKREEKGKKGAAMKEQADKRSKIDIVKEALEKTRMEERKRNLMKRKEQEEKAKEEQKKKRSRFDAAVDTPDRNQTRKASVMDRRGLSDNDRRENLDRRDSFGNRGNWRGGSDRRDAYGRRDVGNDSRRDSDPIKREPDQRNRFSDPRNVRDSNPRNSRDSHFNRGDSSRSPFGNVQGHKSRFDNPQTPNQTLNVAPNQNMGNVNYATPRTYKEYKESLMRGGSGPGSQPLSATPPQQDIPHRDVLTSTPRGVGAMRKRSPSPSRDQILRDGRNIRPVHNEHLTHRDVNRILQHEGMPDHNTGMPSPIEHSSPSDIGSHDFIGPHTPDMPEAEDMDKSPEMKASILSLLTGKSKQTDGYLSLGEDNVESDDDMDMQLKGFKRPLLPVKKGEQGRNEPGLRAHGSRDRDRLVLSAPDDEEHTEEWFDSIMATVGDTEEEEDVLSLYAPSECSLVNKGNRKWDTPPRRGGQESPLKGIMTPSRPGRGSEDDSHGHRSLSQESPSSQSSQEDTFPQQRAYARSMMSALQDQTAGTSGSHPMNMREFIQTSLRRREEGLAQARVQSLAQAKVNKIMQGLAPDDERALVRSAIYLKDNLDETVDMDVVRTALQNIKMKSLMEARANEHMGPQERSRERNPEGKTVDRNVAKSTLFALHAHKDPPKPLSPVYTTPASSDDRCSPALSDWSRHSEDSVKKSKENAAQNLAKTLNTPLMQSMLGFRNASDQGQGNSSNQSDSSNRDLSLPNRSKDVSVSGRSTPSIERDFNFPVLEEKPYEEDISGLRALLPKVLRPDVSNYKISKNIPKGHCYKFLKLGSCPNPHCSYSHVIPAEPVIGDIRACHRGNDLLGAAEAYAFLKAKCGKKEVRPDVVACMIEMCHKTGLIEMVFQVLLPDIKELKLLDTQLCDGLIAMCFPKHCQHLWEVFCFFKQCEEKAIPSKEKIFDLMKDLFMRHDFEKVLMVMQHWSTADIDFNPILDLALHSDAHLNGVVLVVDKLPKPCLVKLNTELLANLQERCLQCCHPHGASVLQAAITEITAGQKAPPAVILSPKNHVLTDLNDSLAQLLSVGKLKDALGIFQKMLTINNADKVAASACGIDMNFVFNQMLMAAVKNMDTRMLLMIFSIGNKGSTLNPQEAMYRLLIIHCVRTNNDGKADLLYKMSPAQKQSVVNIPRKLTFHSNLSLEEIRVILKAYMIDLCRLLRASGKLSSKNIEDFVIDVIVKKVDTNAGGVKVLAAIQNTVDAVNQRIIKVFRHMNPPIAAEVNLTSKKIDITPESVRVHLGALERLSTTSGKNIVFGAKGPQTPKTPGANASTTPKATPPAPGKPTPPGATPRI